MLLEQKLDLQTDGRDIYLYTLKNKHGTEVQLLNFGCTVTSIKTKDKHGNLDDITLGFDKPQSYLGVHPYFGSLVGRYANRIAKGKFELEGQQFQLACNDSEGNHLHGGLKGLSHRVWTPETMLVGNEPSIKLSYISENGEEGYPGQLRMNVTYTLSEDNRLTIDYYSSTDLTTHINLAHHSYFNLAGRTSSENSILDHKIRVNADSFTPLDSSLIPTGEIQDVAGTSFDLRKQQVIGDIIMGDGSDRTAEQLELVGGGLDHNFVINKDRYKSRFAAEVVEPKSGRRVEVITTQPGLQVYTGNMLAEMTGKNGTVYKKHSGLCLETQHFPDTPNHPHFPSSIITVDKLYLHQVIYAFGLDSDSPTSTDRKPLF